MENIIEENKLQTISKEEFLQKIYANFYFYFHLVILEENFNH